MLRDIHGYKSEEFLFLVKGPVGKWGVVQGGMSFLKCENFFMLLMTAHPTFALMNWIILIIAGFLETAFTFCLGKAQAANTTPYGWYIGMIISMAFSLGLLMKAAQSLPIGTAYTVWTGIGAVGTVLMGIFIFKDPVNMWRIIFISLLIGSIIGLKVVGE